MDIAPYLLDLFQSHCLAPATLGKHRVANSSFTDPLGSDTSLSALLRHFMRVAFLAHPPAHTRPRITWDVAQILDHLCSWSMIPDFSFRQLTHHTFALVLIFSCQHISKLTFLAINNPFCIISDDCIILQFGPGLKQDHSGHFALIRLIRAPDMELCTVHNLQAYLDMVHPLRSSDSLFTTSTPPFGAAACGTLCQWFASILQGAGVNATQ